MKEIRKIVARYDLLDHGREKSALATVVSVEQSSYRRIGARMLVTERGTYVGGISGGCLEGDALRRARTAILKGKPSMVTYDTLEEDDHQIGVGLGCNGKIEVLFTPLDPTDPQNPVAVLRSCLEKREPTILAQVVGEANQYPAALNGRLYAQQQLPLLAADYGFAMERLLASAAKVGQLQKSRMFTLRQTTKSDKQEKSRECQVLFEFLRPALKLTIVGDNYDIEPFFGLCQELGWGLQLVGLQRKFSKAAFAAAQGVYAYTELATLQPDAYTAVLVMSHDYHKDLLALQHFLPLEPPYLGLLGPRKRMLKLHAELVSDGLDLQNYPHLYAPTGLDIGAESPEEIAAAIVAEIIAVFRNRSGGKLRERVGSIHE